MVELSICDAELLGGEGDLSRNYDFINCSTAVANTSVL